MFLFVPAEFILLKISQYINFNTSKDHQIIFQNYFIFNFAENKNQASNIL